MTLPPSSVLRFFCLVVFLGVALGLTVGPVHLPMPTGGYMSYTRNVTSNTTIIECDYSLDEGEEVTRVVWQFFEDQKPVGEYIWSPRTGGNASGRLQGVVNLTRSDAALQLTELRYNLAGDYSCRVELSSGEAQETEPWELLILDIIGTSHVSTSNQDCSFTVSYKSPLMFPEPTVAAGMYSDSHGGFVKQVTGFKWQKVVMGNASTQVSFNNFTYEVTPETPEDAYFRVSLGLTKKNGDYFSLGSSSSTFSELKLHGCPDLMTGENKEVNYFSKNRPCRGGHKPLAKAKITCKDGYRAVGKVQSVTLSCDISLMWEPPIKESPVDEDLVCEVDPTVDEGGDYVNGNPRTTLLSSSLLAVSLLFLLLG